MAKSTGLGLMELPTIFEQLRPDVVLTVGDRFETMATALAAAYMNIPLAHTMGGEVSGTIDESIRHAVTKFAHIHFPACSDARDRIIKLGERREDVHLVGCPRIDLVAEVLEKDRNGIGSDLFATGVGGEFDLNNPFLMVSQHSVTTEYGEGERQISETLKAVHKLGMFPRSPCGLMLTPAQRTLHGGCASFASIAAIQGFTSLRTSRQTCISVSCEEPSAYWEFQQRDSRRCFYRHTVSQHWDSPGDAPAWQQRHGRGSPA